MNNRSHAAGPRCGDKTTIDELKVYNRVFTLAQQCALVIGVTRSGELHPALARPAATALRQRPFDPHSKLSRNRPASTHALTSLVSPVETRIAVAV